MVSPFTRGQTGVTSAAMTYSDCSMFCGRVRAIRWRTAPPHPDGHGLAPARRRHKARGCAIDSGSHHLARAKPMHAGRILQLDHNQCVLNAPGLLSTANAHEARAKLSICARPRRPRAEVRARAQGHTASKKQRRYNSVSVPAKTHHRQLGRIRLAADTNQGPVRIRHGITIGYRGRIDSVRKQSPSAPRARVRALYEDGRGPVQIRRAIEAVGQASLLPRQAQKMIFSAKISEASI